MSLPENSLYFRTHELVVGQKVTTTGTPVEPPQARRFLNRINFSIEKTTTPNPNKSKITLHNISQESRNFLEQRDLIVFFKAGFNGEASNIFIGDVLRRETNRSGPDVTYTLECGDAERILQTARVNISLGAGATNIQLFEAAANALGLSFGVSIGITPQTFQNGYSFSGLASDLLTEQTRKIGLEWNIQDGELRILPPRVTDGQEAVVVSSKTGLIGFPTKTIDGVKFKTLLNPAIRPGRAIKIESRQFQGQLGPTASLLASTALIESGDVVKCRTATFRGDTRQGEWVTEVEAVVPQTGAI